MRSKTRRARSYRKCLHDELGNPEPPEKFKQLRGKRKTGAAIEGTSARPSRLKWLMIGAVIVIVVALAVTILMFTCRPSSKSVGTITSPLPSSTVALISEKSIAALPFENLSRDPDNAYFAIGIQDEILTRLAKIAALKVISRTSTQQYATRPGNLSEIANQLGVANILEGSVQKAGAEVHINTQLIRAATNEHLWAESYTRKLDNIFAVEAEVALAVAEALKAKLSGAEQQALGQKPTNSPEAYEAYLRALVLWREVSNDKRLKAVGELEKAVRLDPGFAFAWALLNNRSAERRAVAEETLSSALKLNPDLPEVQLAQGFFQYWVLRDYDAAQRSFEQLRPRLPNSPDIHEAFYLVSAAQGKLDESRVHTDEAVALNPRDSLLRLEAAWVRTATRDFPAALKSYDEALSIWPTDASLIAGKVFLYQALGDLDKAEVLVTLLHPTIEDMRGIGAICYQEELLRRHNSPRLQTAISLLQAWLVQNDSSPSKRADARNTLGYLQQFSGDTAAAKTSYVEARDQYEQMLKEQPANAHEICQNLADVYAGLEDHERALTFADRAISLIVPLKNPVRAAKYEETRARIAARFGMKDMAIPALEHLLKISYGDPLTPALLRLDPEFDSLRGDPRFQKLVSESKPKP
jgi:TolB-like protein